MNNSNVLRQVTTLTEFLDRLARASDDALNSPQGQSEFNRGRCAAFQEIWNLIRSDPAHLVQLDWTADPVSGCSNTSQAYKDICAEVEKILQDGGGWILDTLWVRQKAHLIVAQLAHTYHMQPAPPHIENSSSSAVPENLHMV